MSELRTKRTQRAPPQRIILGIDPGVAIVGYAVVGEQRGNLSLLACDVIRTPASLSLSDRLQHIFEQMQTLIERFHPNEAAVESLFFSTNRKTAIPVAHARGVILLALMSLFPWFCRELSLRKKPARLTFGFSGS
jgi:crossover junction endodeoxyribonuclease RuvC